MRFLTSSLLVSFVFASALYADEFEKADQLFAKRQDNLTAENLATVAQAKAEYTRLLAVNPVRAMEGLGKLAYFEGELLTPDTDKVRREQIFDECRKQVETLATVAHAQTQYHYWKTVCLAFWVQVIGVPPLNDILSLRTFFNSMVDDALNFKEQDFLDRLQIDLRYHGGGLHRMIGGIYAQDLSKILRPSQLPNYEKALEFVERAFDTDNFPGDPNAGENYFCNFRMKAKVLALKGDKPAAANVLKEAIADIESMGDNLPKGMEPETRAELRKMKEFLATLQ